MRAAVIQLAGTLPPLLGDDPVQFQTFRQHHGCVPQRRSFPRSCSQSLITRDSGLVTLKTDPLFDPLRKEPRFQGAMRELKCP
jgi:hypothetical protein